MIPSDWTVLHPEIEDVTVFVIGEENLEGTENLLCRIVFVPVKDWNRELCCHIIVEADASLHVETFMILDNSRK